MGDRAVLAEVDDLAAAMALHAALAARAPSGVADIVPAARTVLVGFDPRRIAPDAVRAWIHAAARTTDGSDPPPGRLVELPVRYDGPDLLETADLLGIPVATLVARHTASTWSVAFTGFAPGFAYLVSAEWPWDVPRLAQPRTRVPAGAVGLAGAFSGAYPRDTPGGWRLIATTDAALFDPDAADPVLLPPRARVRFVPERAVARAANPAPAPAPPAPVPAATAPASARPGPGTPALRVIATGPLATVQDLGRPSRAALGVAPSGALDRAALRTANRLVGNTAHAAGIEVVLGGFRAEALRDTWVAVVGAFGDLLVDDRPVDAVAPVRVPAGAVLSIGPARAGLRWYVALRGGIAAPTVLGSASTDVLARLGPPALRPGDVLSLGAEGTDPVPAVDVMPWSVPPPLLDVPVTPGPRTDWFTEAARTAVFAAPWTVSGDADRVGIRLDGPVLERCRGGELPSEGMVPGAIQVPPHGRPVVLLADGPVTGGYPVIAVVTDAAQDALAQVRPGDRVRFRSA